MISPVSIDMREYQVTPVFKHEQLENINKSEQAGMPVYEMREVVQIQIAGRKDYSPVEPVDGMWKRDGIRTITWAERWPDQYIAFKGGQAAEARGTPLEMLKPFGVTPEQISICRALKIYSVEALFGLEGPAQKALGMSQNKLKEAAQKFMATQQGGNAAAAEIEALKAEIAALRSTQVPAQETPPEVIDEMIAKHDEAYADLSNDDLKERIASIAGTRPRGNPSRETLVQSLAELEAA